jgi:hypothetical protein
MLYFAFFFLKTKVIDKTIILPILYMCGFFLIVSLAVLVKSAVENSIVKGCDK